VSDKDLQDFPKASQHCQEFWELVGHHVPEWKYVRDSKMTSGELRRDFIHSHAIVLQALARAGKALYDTHPQDVAKRLQRLKTIDWSRSNAPLWEGRAMVGGAMAKSGQNVTLTCNEIKRVLGLALTPDEEAAEAAHRAARGPQQKTKARKHG
jgi:DNA sulfur modification protein DndB